MTWVLVIGAGWLLLAALVAVMLGRSVRLADAKSSADTAVDEPNFVVDLATARGGRTAATILRFPTPPVDGELSTDPPTRDTPTIPGIPVARPPAPGVGGPGSQDAPIRRTGLA